MPEQARPAIPQFGLWSQFSKSIKYRLPNKSVTILKTSIGLAWRKSFPASLINIPTRTFNQTENLCSKVGSSV